jgi:hypothetical protein
VLVVIVLVAAVVAIGVVVVVSGIGKCAVVDGGFSDWSEVVGLLDGIVLADSSWVPSALVVPVWTVRGSIVVDSGVPVAKGMQNSV